MKKCAICQKKAKKAGMRKKLRGHYNPTGKRKQLPNLQWVKLPNGKRIRICTKCLKTLEKKGQFEIELSGV